MNDLEKLAEFICSHSLDIQPGDRVQINLMGEGMALVKSLYKVLLQLNALPHLTVKDNELVSLFFQHASQNQMRRLVEIEAAEHEWSDAVVNIVGHTEINYLDPVPSETISFYENISKPIKLLCVERKWLTLIYPTHACAAQAGMDYTRFQKLIFDATLQTDWQEMAIYQDELKDRLDKGGELTILSDDTNLTVTIQNRSAAAYWGRKNLPDGEVMIAPVETSAEGYITFNIPSLKRGKRVSDIYLEFRNGRVTHARAGENQGFLETLLKTDDGASFMGELAFGTNPLITQYTGLTLLDEKIAGTVHIALGHSYPEIGGLNSSAIHWDLIKDLRRSGCILIDNKEILLPYAPKN